MKVPQAQCPTRVATQAFSFWGDKGLYTPVAGGDFETAAADWTLTGPALVVEDNEHFFISAPTDSHSLELQGGASAVSPVMCAGKGYPDARAFARSLGGRGVLKVEVLNVDAAGVIRSTKSTAKLGHTTMWRPTPELRISQGTAAKHGGLIRLRFTSPSGSAWRVDDVQLDPRLAR